MARSAVPSSARDALGLLAQGASRLRAELHFSWSAVVEQCVLRLLADSAGEPLPPMVAVVGGASSGKSTVFNNLLNGHLASRITARGHTTVGLILAVHEDQRERVARLLKDNLLLPGYDAVLAEVDHNVTGDPAVVTLIHHGEEQLAGVLLADTPDFTSDAARREGDLALNLLPWFDRIIVVVDHERWYDRQAVAQLRNASTRLGQARAALFNRTREGAMDEADSEELRRRGERLGADPMLVLEFRRGRGFCRFPPGTLDAVHEFLDAPPADRTPALLATIGESANEILNQNAERAQRLEELRRAVTAVRDRSVPPSWDCMSALMTPAERRQLDLVARVLRLRETRDWVAERTRRFGEGLRRFPVLGPLLSSRPLPAGPAERPDRRALVRSHYEEIARRQRAEIHQIEAGSRFWSEVRKWTGQEPRHAPFEWSSRREEEVTRAAEEFDQALTAWNEKVEAECRDAGASVHGAVGIGAIGLAVVLIAAPGPVTALTLVAAKAAVAAALSELAVATGAGALIGRQLHRLVAVAQERLLGSPEFNAVRRGADQYRVLLGRAGDEAAAEAVADAARLVIPARDELGEALRRIAKQAGARD